MLENEEENVWKRKIFKPRRLLRVVVDKVQQRRNTPQDVITSFRIGTRWGAKDLCHKGVCWRVNHAWRVVRHNNETSSSNHLDNEVIAVTMSGEREGGRREESDDVSLASAVGIANSDLVRVSDVA